MIIEFRFDRNLSGHKNVLLIALLCRVQRRWLAICVRALSPVKCQNETKAFGFGSKSIRVGKRRKKKEERDREKKTHNEPEFSRPTGQRITLCSYIYDL